MSHGRDSSIVALSVIETCCHRAQVFFLRETRW